MNRPSKPKVKNLSGIVVFVLLLPLGVLPANNAYSQSTDTNGVLSGALACGNAFEQGVSSGYRCFMEQMVNGMVNGLVLDQTTQYANAYGKRLFGEHFSFANRMTYSQMGGGFSGEMDTVVPLSALAGFAGFGGSEADTESGALFFQQGVTSWTDGQGLQRRQSLTSILEQIMDIDRESVELQALSIPDDQKYFASFSFMNRKILLLRQAEELYEKLGEKTTAEDAAIISVGYFGTGEFEKAESHMKECSEKAETPIVRATALRSLAKWAIERGDHSRATELYDKALDVLNEIDMPNKDMKINFIMTANLFKVQDAISLNDYSSAVRSLKELADHSQDLRCTPARRQWLEGIYDMERMLTQHMGDNIAALPGVDGQAKCIYDPPRSDLVKSAKGLAPYTGAYTFQNLRLRVFMWDDDTLSIAIPGQPYYLLKAKEDEGHFEVLGLSGSTAIFHRRSANDALVLELIQPDDRSLWSRSG